MALWRLYYHLIWATKNRLPLITKDIEPKLYDYIIGKADSIDCITHAIGGIENHIHLVVSIPPKLSITAFVQNIKGSSSHQVNYEIRNSQTTFVWQRGYGVFSLSEKKLDVAIDYVINQKQHHSEGTLIRLLETDSEEDNAPKLKPTAKAAKANSFQPLSKSSSQVVVTNQIYSILWD